MIKDFKLIEHNLIPGSLFVLNMSLVHIIYLNFAGQLFSIPSLVVSLCTAILAAGVFQKSKVMMLPGIVIYIISLILFL